jgi:hypothetical protein
MIAADMPAKKPLAVESGWRSQIQKSGLKRATM